MDTEPITEHAQLYAGGAMLVRNNHPVVDSIYPLADWIRNSRRGGGKVYRRTIVVMEDWEEVK